MNRRQVIKKVQDEARRQGLDCQTVEMTRHTAIVVAGVKTGIGRHNEVPERTAQSIWKQFEGVFGERWWR